MSILSLLAGPILKNIGSVAKVFLGSKAERDQAIAEEMKSIQDAYKTELLAPEKLSWWGRFIDGTNRLVRPFFTFGTIALFIWAAIDPVSFQVTMVAMAAVPEMLWYIILTIIGFWFGGRLLERTPTTVKPLSASALENLLNMQKKLGALDDEPVQPPSVDPTVPVPVKPEAPPEPPVTPTVNKKKPWEGRRDR